MVGLLVLIAQPHTVVTLGLLSFVPMAYFWRRQHMHSRLLFLVAVATVLSTTFFELYAHFYGAWYTLGNLPRLGQYFTAEAFLASFIQVLYMITLYEFFCDDKKTAARLPGRAWGVLITALAFSGVVSALYIFPLFFVSYAFLVLLLTSSALTMLWIGTRRTQIPFLMLVTRLGLFLAIWLPIVAVYELVAVATGARIYANSHEYVAMFTILGNHIPIEALLLAVLSPVWVVTLYELHVDDGR